MDLFTIDEKIRVFISSAMGTEKVSDVDNDFNWLEFRDSVKKELLRCPYISVFMIEDYASSRKSNDYMVRNVDLSDVVVLLIKNEFRKGTMVEYTRCRQTNKPLLVFFFGDENASEEVKKLREDIEKSDYCKYKLMHDFRNAEKIIVNDVIRDVIFNYHCNLLTLSNSESIDINGFHEKVTCNNDSYILPKTALSPFESCYKTIYRYIDLPELANPKDQKDQSSLHIIGEQVIKWVFTGERFLTSDVKSVLVSSVAEIYPKSDWYSKRLDAIDFFIKGDIDQAFLSEKEALKFAEDANIAEWIVTNILIDLRNLEFLCSKEQFKSQDKEYQKRLSALNTVVHVPGLDRYLENTYELLLNEEIDRNTASVGTIFFGNNFDRIISKIENYLFGALLCGSYTHLRLTRKVLATIFYRTGKLYNSPELLYSAMKMYLFSGKYQDFIRLSNLEWTNISNIIITKAEELWDQAKNIQENSHTLICISVLHRVGLYLNDKSFNEAEKFLIELSSRLPLDISENYFDCLLNVYGRMEQENIVKILTTIIENHSYITAYKLTELIGGVDVASISNETLLSFCESMKKGWPDIVHRNGDPQCLSNLVNTKPDIFSLLETLPDNGLSERQKLIYDFNTNRGDWGAIILSELQIAEKQFKANSNKSFYFDLETNPYYLIAEILGNKPSSEIIGILTEKLFPLCIEVLGSDCSVDIKDPCAECLCTVLGYYKKNGIPIPQTLIDCIDNVTLKSPSNHAMTFRSHEGLWCRLLILKIIVGVLDKQVLIQWCFSYSKKDTKERRSLVKCLKTYLQYSTDINADADSLMISIVFQCCEDQDVYIRAIACDCLWYILESQYASQAEEKLDEMVIDAAPAIKNRLLNICEENNPNHRSIINKIIISLINDSNYLVRERAKDLLKINLETPGL